VSFCPSHKTWKQTYLFSEVLNLAVEFNPVTFKDTAFVTITDVVTTVLEANPLRKGLILVNIGSEACYLKCDGDASALTKTIPMAANGSGVVVMDDGLLTRGNITAKVIKAGKETQISIEEGE